MYLRTSREGTRPSRRTTRRQAPSRPGGVRGVRWGCKKARAGVGRLENLPPASGTWDKAGNRARWSPEAVVRIFHGCPRLQTHGWAPCRAPWAAAATAAITRRKPAANSNRHFSPAKFSLWAVGRGKYRHLLLPSPVRMCVCAIFRAQVRLQAQSSPSPVQGSVEGVY
jgi:hypothetical protein